MQYTHDFKVACCDLLSSFDCVLDTNNSRLLIRDTVHKRRDTESYHKSENDTYNTDDRSVVNLFRFQNLSSLENKIPKHKPARQKRQHGKSYFVASAFHLIVDQVKYDGK